MQYHLLGTSDNVCSATFYDQGGWGHGNGCMKYIETLATKRGRGSLRILDYFFASKVK